MTNDEPLTDAERSILYAAGYIPAGGGNINGDGVIWLKFEKDGQIQTGTHAEWRQVIAGPNKPPTEDEIAFGKDAWVYCNQHCRTHETGWCTVSPMDKVGLGVTTAKEAYAKCRAWGFPLYADRVNA